MINEDADNIVFQHTDYSGDKMALIRRGAPSGTELPWAVWMEGDESSYQDATSVYLDHDAMVRLHSAIGAELSANPQVVTEQTPDWDDVAADIKAMRDTLEEGMRLLTRAEKAKEIADEETLAADYLRCSSRHPRLINERCYLRVGHSNTYHEGENHVWLGGQS